MSPLVVTLPCIGAFDDHGHKTALRDPPMDLKGGEKLTARNSLTQETGTSLNAIHLIAGSFSCNKADQHW